MKPKAVDEYIGNFPKGQKEKLVEIRKIIRAVLPDTLEALKWGAPAIVDKDGMILVIFSGHKKHVNLVGTPSTREALQSELSDYETGKGSVKLLYDKPLPVELIENFVLYRANEYRQNGIKWM